MTTETTAREAGQDFIRDIIRDDLAAGRRNTVVTRFPPEPNGYLHIGHAKSICLNFGVADEFGGHCNLRYDDTNPTKEEQEYIDAIERDVRWLGFDWGEHLYHASDYFERLYEWAEHLIRAGKAYVDDQTQDEMRATRGTLTEAGTESPYRGRGVEENLDLFRRMRAGEFPNGARVLRAKIDMGSGNINLRDPVLYRILHAEHPRTGRKWCIYPSYDFAHGQSDSIEGITHSLCTLEFEDHRPLYDWFLENLPVPSRPHQYEFARLNLTYTVLSKRVLTELVRGGHVGGWDDPRMPTLAGLRRRGVPPAAIRDFVKRIGVAKANSVVDMAMLEFSIREHLNKTALRRMAVLRPLKIVIENYPQGGSEELEAVNHPENPAAGTRRIRFGRELFIERDDFMEDPPKKFFRLAPGREARLRYAYFVTCREAVKNAAGEVTELRCTYDPATRGGNAPDGRKVQATLHWVSADGRRAGGGASLQSAVLALPIRAAAISPLISIPIRSKSSPMRASSPPWPAKFRRGGAVRAAGLFLPRSGFDARSAGVQPHGRLARHLGQGFRRRLRRAVHHCYSLASAFPPRVALVRSFEACGRKFRRCDGCAGRIAIITARSDAAVRRLAAGRLIPPEQPDQLALNAHAVGRQDAHLVRGIGRLERDRGAAPPEALKGRLLVVDQGDDDIAGIGAVTALEERNIAVEDAGIDHRVAAHFQREVFSRRQQLRRHVDRGAACLDRLDRRAGGDAAHDRHGDRPSALVFGGGPDAAQIPFDHARREAARAAGGDSVRDRFGQLDHFDRPRPVGQAADEASLLERRDQAVNARFRAQVERVLHLVEGGWNSGLLEALMDKTQELGLLACEHRAASPGPLGGRNKS